MTLVQLIAALAGTVLSLSFSYVPGLSDWYDKQSQVAKSGIMALMIVLVGVGTFVYTCKWSAACLQTNWQEYATAIFYALVANQSVYSISPDKSKLIQAVKPSDTPKG